MVNEIVTTFLWLMFFGTIGIISIPVSVWFFIVYKTSLSTYEDSDDN